MTLVTRRHESGLVLAEDAMDEARLNRALKQIHRDYVLQKAHRANVPGGWAYKVVHVPSGLVAFTWMDEFGRPLPLSSGLIDEFQRRLIGERGNATVVDADEHNRRLLERRRKDADDGAMSVIEDHRARVERGRVSVALGASKPRYWRRENARPSSGLRDG